MAQSNRDNVTTDAPDVSNLWAIAGAAANYDVHNNAPLNGISGDSGPGFIVQLLPVPQGFEAITDPGARMNAFRAYASAALRVGQAAVKASKAPTAEIAQAAVSSVLAGTYKPGRDVDNGIIKSQADLELKSRVRENIMAQVNAKVAAGEMVAPTEAEIDNTVNASTEAFLKTPRGQEVNTEIRAAILARGTYVVSRKGMGAKAISGIAVSM